MIVTTTLWRLGKKALHFFYRRNAQKIFCFYRVLANGFQLIKARVVRCLCYKCNLCSSSSQSVDETMAIKQCFPVVMFVMLYKVVLSFDCG